MSLGKPFMQQQRVGMAAGAENQMPPLAAYEDWWAASVPLEYQGRLSPRLYRRIATMRRAGESFRVIGQAVGYSDDNASSRAKKAWLNLPETLR